MKHKTLSKWFLSASVCVLSLSTPLATIQAHSAPSVVTNDVLKENIKVTQESPPTEPEMPEKPPVDIENPPIDQKEPEKPVENIHPALKLLNEAKTQQEKKDIVLRHIENLNTSYSIENAKFAGELIVFYNDTTSLDRIEFIEKLRMNIMKKNMRDVAVVYEHIARFAIEQLDKNIDKISREEALGYYSTAQNMVYFINEREVIDEINQLLTKYEKKIFGGDEGKYIPELDPRPDGDPLTIKPGDMTNNKFKPGVDRDKIDLTWGPNVDMGKYNYGTFPIPNKTGSVIPSRVGIDFNLLNTYNVSSAYLSAFSDLDELYKEMYGDEIKGEDYPLSTLTIQYTLDKDADSPIYHDTGIYVGLDGTISYADALGALKQIAIKAGKPFVDDQKRAISLIDGKVILIEDRNARFPVVEFLSQFKDLSVNVKAQDTRSGTKMELVDLVELRRVVSVHIDGKPVMLESRPIVDNSVVLFPIKEIAKAFGGQVSETDKSTTVVIGSNKFEFVDGQTSVLVNNQAVDAKTEVRKAKDGTRMAPIQPLLDAMNYTIKVETEKEEVHFIKK